jgi:hypothetical protein
MFAYQFRGDTLMLLNFEVYLGLVFADALGGRRGHLRRPFFALSLSFEGSKATPRIALRYG